jgi:two-component system phosphate regulon sensor histidine kinase PhoR
MPMSSSAAAPVAAVEAARMDASRYNLRMAAAPLVPPLTPPRPAAPLAPVLLAVLAAAEMAALLMLLSAAAPLAPATRAWGGAALLLIIGLNLAALLMLRRYWIAPARRLIDAAGKMAQGQWHVRVDSVGAHEMRLLAQRMNLVAQQVQNQLDEIGKQRRDLRGLVDTLPDPILVTDAAHRIRLINSPAADLLQLSQLQAIGRKTVAVVSDDPLLQLLEAAATPPGQWDTAAADRVIPAPIHREVRLVRGEQRLVYQAVALGTAAGGVLLVLRDVSRMAYTVQMKTDFVANASHELRTPLAAIKIAMETLKDAVDDDPPQAQRCVDIIDGHVGRLEDILRDLLDLSRLESTGIQPTIDDVRPAELFTMVRSTMGAAARRKGVELRLWEGPGAPASFASDDRLLHLVLKNLVENSIKFTPAGGSVTVSIDAVNGEEPAHASGEAPTLALSVADTGVGIPPEHRDRVFERFYQVDPARSGTAGRGTGLGLAIVKHAIAALGGTVRLESTVGRGTTVMCLLPTQLVNQQDGGTK